MDHTLDSLGGCFISTGGDDGGLFAWWPIPPVGLIGLVTSCWIHGCRLGLYLVQADNDPLRRRTSLKCTRVTGLVGSPMCL